MKKYFLIIAITAFLLGTSNIAPAAEVFPEFSSKTLSGEAVSSAIFADKKVTVINIWATWCPPCVQEMPGLGKMGRSMPEGTRLLGVALDVTEDDPKTKEAAQSILIQANADFVQILFSKEMIPYLQENAQYIPTTIFVDSKGNILGKPLVGAHTEEDYRAELDKILKALP